MEEKPLALYIFELEDDTPKQYQVTNSKIPNENCISVKVSLKESLQVDKLKIVFDGIIPKVEHKEGLNDVKETEFGWELTDEVTAEPVKSEKEIQREALLKQLAELDSQPTE